MKRVMNRKEAEQHINALPLRERVIDHLALFVGMRPGEILALQRRHIAEDCGELAIEQRLYRGEIDDPKTRSSKRDRRHSFADGEGAAGMDGAGAQALRCVGIRFGEPSKAVMEG